MSFTWLKKDQTNLFHFLPLQDNTFMIITLEKKTFPTSCILYPSCMCLTNKTFCCWPQTGDPLILSPVSSLLFSPGTSLTMTLIPRAQTFHSFLSDEHADEETQHQEEALSPSTGYESSCSPRPLQWQAMPYQKTGHLTHYFREAVEIM